jgi:CHAD domain-containing protein/adenylate cyclase class IV
MDREVELKLAAREAVSDRALIEALARRGRVWGDRTVEQVDTYFDTSAATLLGAGLSARARRTEGGLALEVKPIPIEPTLVMDRAELSAQVSAVGDVSQALRDLLATGASLEVDGPFEPVVELCTRRRRLDYGDDALEAEACIDRVVVRRSDGTEVGQFTEVELELRRGDPAALATLGELGPELGLEPSGRNKYVRAREILGLPPPRFGADAPSFDVTTPIDEVARSVARHQLETMRSYEPGTRVGLDTEHLHKMRVATRRLRTALRVFAKALPREEAAYLADELRWLGRSLGEVRDLDVQILSLPVWRSALGSRPADGWAALAELLHQRRAQARGRLLGALDSPRYATLCRRAERVFAAGAGSGAPIGVRAGHLVRKRYRRFQAGVERFRATHSVEDAHRLRILGKRLRYAAEFLRPILRRSVRGALDELEIFQDALGELQDAIAAGALAEEVYASSGEAADPALAFVLGLLAGSAAQLERDARTRVDEALAHLERANRASELDDPIGV